MDADTTTHLPCEKPEDTDLRPALALAAFLLFLYLLSYSGVPHNPDEWYYLTGTQAAVTGNLRNVQAHGWLFSLLIVPFYVAAMAISDLGSFQAATLLNNVIVAATAVTLLRTLAETKISRGSRVAAALIFGLGTLAWPYSRYLFREPAAGLFLLGTVWGIEHFSQHKRPAALLAAGLAFVCAVAVKYTMLAFLPFLALAALWASACFWWPKLTARLWLVGITVAGALLGIILWGTGGMTLLARAVPDYLRQWPNLNAFAALWISPGWGLLLYAPALILGVVGGVQFARHAPIVAFIGLGGSLFYILASTTNPFWWGYWAFGPRQLVPLLPLLCLPIPFGLQWLKTHWGRWGLITAGVLIGLSVLIQLVGVLVPFNEYARQVLLRANLTGPAITWRWDLWPILGMIRFARPALLDIAWLAGRVEATVTFRWPVFAVLLTATLLSGLWLWYLVRRTQSVRSSVADWISLTLCIMWLPAAILSVRQVYLDERYQPALGFPVAAEIVRQEQRLGDLLVTDLWTENLNGPLVAMLNYCRGGCPPRLDLTREDLIHREIDWQRTRLADLAGYRRAWLVLERVAERDPNSIVERWLGQVGYLERCQWTGPQVRLCLYGLGPGVPLGQGSAGVAFGDVLRLRSAEISLTGGDGSAGVPARPGDQLLIDLAWETVGAPAADYVISLQLIGPDGRLAAGADVQPGNGFQPTSTWRVGERLADRRALTIPDTADAGRYSLSLIVYDPANGQRLSVRSAAGAVGDMLPLLMVEVGP